MHEPKINNNYSFLHSLTPYVVFTIIVFAYNLIYLKYGFNATDEGYLLALGKRIADGESVYKDFYFLKTPLSIYIQALLIEVFGDNYTVLFSRFYWAFQMWLMVILASFLYRKLVRPWELFLLLVSSFTISTMLLSFTWYSYDGVFFAAIALLLFIYQRYYISGAILFLCFFAKQTYILFIPVLIVLIIIMTLFGTRDTRINLRNVFKLSIGFVIPLLVYILYLLLNNNFASFIENIFLLPAKSSGKGFIFGIVQNNPSAVIVSLPVILTAINILFAPPRKWLLPLMVLIPFSVYIFVTGPANFVFALAFLNYTVLIVSLIKCRGEQPGADNKNNILAAIALFAIVMIYMSGFTYSGIIFTFSASGIALPFMYIILKKYINFNFRNLVALSVLLVIFGFGAYYKHNNVYRDKPRKELTEKFTSGKLKGIYSTPRNVRQITDILSTITQYSSEGDYIIIYPDFPILYYLADRKNPTPIAWYYRYEFNKEMLERAFQSLDQNPPKVVFVQEYAEADFARTGAKYQYRAPSKYAPMFDYIVKNYKYYGKVDDIFLFIP